MAIFSTRTFRYERKKLKRGVVHVGFGNFARSFITDIFDDVAEKGFTDFGLVAIAPSTRQELDFKILEKQDNIFHLLRQNGGEICQRIGVLLETIIGATHNTKAMNAMARPETQIVTMTVTGDGYFPEKPKDPSTLLKQNEDVAALYSKEWSKLQTPPGWIVAALYQRFEAGQKPFLVMSCDNILFNGKKIKDLLQRLAQETGDAKFIEYVQTQVFCPNTTVDRITPEQNYDAQANHLLNKARDAAMIETASGQKISDRRPVISEKHRELVIEDKGDIPAHIRQALTAAKVTFTDNIAPYQDRKIRLLNGGHMLFGVGGKIMQIDTVRKAMKDNELRALFDALLEQSAASLAPNQPEDIHAYRELVVDRLENPHLTDAVERLVSATTGKIHARFLNSAAIENPGFQSDASAFAIATWMRYLQGRDDSGNPYSLDAADVGMAEKLGLSDFHSPDLQKNLCQFLTKSDLADVTPAWHVFTAQIVIDAQSIQENGLRAAIKERFASKPVHNKVFQQAAAIPLAAAAPAG